MELNGFFEIRLVKNHLIDTAASPGEKTDEKELNCFNRFVQRLKNRFK